MSFRLRIPQYSGKDGTILLASMLPLTVLLNIFLFGGRYFAGAAPFLSATAATFLVLGFAYLYYTYVALLLARRFPGAERSNRRLLLALALFLLSDYVLLAGMLRAYDALSFLGYRYLESDLLVIVCLCAILTIFLTFLNEGIARFAHYKRTLRETEQLRHAYLQSQLMSLKSQVNPHFLFNSLNTLSSLIPENPDSAEAFLDELSKVYRYLLRNNEDYLVPLRQELAFLRSYAYLLRERHGSAFRLEVDVDAATQELLLPPLTLQFVFEDMLEQNALSREQPLQVRLGSMGKTLVIRNNRQERIMSERALSGDANLENIREKFRLLVGKVLHIEDTPAERIIIVPLIAKPEGAVV
ncbi:sensor histidine kinase [Flaviaesturariibacter flavus]|nr:histidine kinase [Flaviaesturariibacter flavus]